ncbi:MAG: site-specific integrase [Candidatus Methanomethyliaceae archaeon]
MAIEQLRNGKWRVREPNGRKPDGKPDYIVRTFDRKKDAEAFQAEVRYKKNQGLVALPAKKTFGQLIDEFLEVKRVKRRRRTIDGYEHIAERHVKPALGHYSLEAIVKSPLVLEKYLLSLREVSGKGRNRKGKPLSQKTIAHHRQFIHSVLEWAFKKRLIPHNPAKLIDPDLPRCQKVERTIPTKEDVEKLLNHLKGNYELFIPVLLAVKTGMREGEVLGLRWQDVDFENKVLYVRQAAKWTKKDGLFFEEPKTPESQQPIEIEEKLVACLREHQRNQKKMAMKLGLGKAYNPLNLVVCRKDGRPFKPNHFSSRISKVMKRLGITGNFHSLRHFHGTLLIDLGFDIQTVAARLRHSNPTTTLNIYVKTRRERLREAAKTFEDWLSV